MHLVPSWSGLPTSHFECVLPSFILFRFLRLHSLPSHESVCVCVCVCARARKGCCSGAGVFIRVYLGDLHYQLPLSGLWNGNVMNAQMSERNEWIRHEATKTSPLRREQTPFWAPCIVPLCCTEVNSKVSGLILWISLSIPNWGDVLMAVQRWHRVISPKNTSQTKLWVIRSETLLFPFLFTNF